MPLTTLLSFPLLFSTSFLSLRLFHSWFFRRLKRIDAEKLLFNSLNNYGSYLIRESESTPGGYALSVRGRDGVKHYKIIQSENGEFFVTARSKFKSIQDLVIHYQEHADGLCANLKKPCAFTDIDVSGQDVDEWQIDRRSVRLGMKLLSSDFIEVWEGTWNSTPVAVKALKLGPQQIITLDNFLQAANLMKKLRHPSITKLYALCSREEPVFVITELMKHGSLLEYLHDKGALLKQPQLIKMAAQVAAGMAYLEDLNIIHRNLSAKNIQVGEDLICKVANFEMARKIDGDNYIIYEAQNGEKFAVKWSSPEVILHNRFSIKSDVWSFGITLYEIITHGKPPYPGMTVTEIVYKTTELGYHMPQPLGCPGDLYEIMLNCWQEDPNNRYTFETLLSKLEPESHAAILY